MDTQSMTPLVLVADDEPTMLELVSRHLKTMDNPKLEVIEASDGEQAWKLAREHLPDLVVLDVMMPGMSGWEVCRKIREDIALAHTGVVMLTGIGENLNQMTSPLYGADAYIDKPFEFGELDSKVKNALAARASQREGIARPSPNGVTGPAREMANEAVREAESLDIEITQASTRDPLTKRAASAKKGLAKAAGRRVSKARPKGGATKKAAPKKKAARTARAKTPAKKSAGKRKASAKKNGAKKTPKRATAKPGKAVANKSSKKSKNAGRGTSKKSVKRPK